MGLAIYRASRIDNWARRSPRVDRNHSTVAEERLAPLPNPFGSSPTGPGYPLDGDETFVTDDRAGLSPAQHVERRLVDLLKTSPIFVSHVQRVARPNPR